MSDTRKLCLDDLCPVPEPIPLSYLDKMPQTLAAKSLRDVIHAVSFAFHTNRPIIFSFGAHVIKCGLSPIIGELIRRNVITAIATNGAAAIHDTEMTLYGETSEDVGIGLLDGTYGTVGNIQDSVNFVNRCINNLHAEGYGKAVGHGLCSLSNHTCYRYHSVFAGAYRYGIPCTCHVAIGTDINHMYDNADGSKIGAATLTDFHKLKEAMRNMAGGGVLLNFGSAVILPEVILKAIALLRYSKVPFDGCVMADFDMNTHYRPTTRIVGTANLLGGRGYSITGHHEIMLPLIGGLILGAIEDT